ncbi:hypothetical protein N665_0339s0077 [Sinapis alba]|nr:hypothetical protein N665_0339s0077 [Sinapis alba]
MMPATVNVHRLATHRCNLKAGSLYSLIGFEVTVSTVPIPLESFRFRNHSEMLGLNNSNNQLPDLIGEIFAVKSTVTDRPQDKNRVMATIKMDKDTSVIMSLFDAQVVKIHTQLEKMGGDPRVIVAISVNPKMVGGRMFLNATSGTHIYLDKETYAGERFFYSLVAQDTGLGPVAPLLKGYAKVESLSIVELNDFVITAPSQDIDFICTGRVTGINMDKGWCYVSCSNVPGNSSVMPHLSRVCLATTPTQLVSSSTMWRCLLQTIANETGEGLFVGFDGVMTKLHNMTASEAVHLLDVDGVSPEETDAPPFFKDMEGNSYTFQVRVSSYNFTSNHQTFTISRILSSVDRLPEPEFVDNGGDEDNGDDDNGNNDHNAGSVRGKVEVGDGSKDEGSSSTMKKAPKE